MKNLDNLKKTMIVQLYWFSRVYLRIVFIS